MRRARPLKEASRPFVQGKSCGKQGPMLPATCAKEAACLPGKGLEALAGQGAAFAPQAV